MKFPPLTQLQTPRLVLRRFRQSDSKNYHRYLSSDPHVAKAMLWQANPDISHAEEVVRRILSRYGTPEGYRWAIALNGSDELIGTISLLRFDETDNSCSFAYMLGKDFWGQGYGTEALKAVFRFAFEQMQVSSIIADHFASNPASGAVMRKAGMQKQGILSGKYEKDGISQDAVVYCITREEWYNAPDRS